MIACPACKRRVVGHTELLRANLGGTVECPRCGAYACLDQMSRLLVACPLAMLLWLAVLHWNILFSGYLFVFSMIVILAGWRLLSAAVLPLLALEKCRDRVVFDRKQTLVSLAILMGTAAAIDGFMSYRSEADTMHATTTVSGTTATSAR